MLSQRGSHPVLELGTTLGVLGGGQLGAMFAEAARRLGYRVAVWAPDPEAPALKIADLPIVASFTDPSALESFAGSIQAATYEWENVPASVIAELERRMSVRPSALVLKLLQNRLEQKTFLSSHGFPVVPFHAVTSPDLLAVPETVGYPSVCKTATLGYDGKGQWRLGGPHDLLALRDTLRGQSASQRGWILEQWMPFEKELSVLVVRSSEGDRRVYPVVENVHESGILRLTRVPAEVTSAVSDSAATLAASVIDVLEGVGVFCIELFLMADGRLYVNEVAPRPHNSGHYTLDACTVSQFEQQARALCGLPLGEVRLLCPAVMLNLIGDDLARVSRHEGLATLLRTPGARLRVYGKQASRPGRKMGHVTFLGDKEEDAWNTAMAAWNLLRSPELESMTQ
ncbi:MAG: 5-(carboxyamino)imidazole ribonucleotide synthase [Nitrospiraceae bacterium]